MMVPGRLAAQNKNALRDPYRRCESTWNEEEERWRGGGCHHDLARGILVGDLMREEGPHESRSRLLSGRENPTVVLPRA